MTEQEKLFNNILNESKLNEGYVTNAGEMFDNQTFDQKYGDSLAEDEEVENMIDPKIKKLFEDIFVGTEIKSKRLNEIGPGKVQVMTLNQLRYVIKACQEMIEEVQENGEVGMAIKKASALYRIAQRDFSDGDF